MKQEKDLNLFKVIGIYLGVSFMANMTAMFSLAPLYQNQIIRSGEEWNYTVLVLGGTDLFMLPLTFMIPSLIAFIYLFPVYAPYFPWTSKRNIDDRSRKRVINSPLMVSLLSIIGWAVQAIGFLIIIETRGLDLPPHVPLRFALEMIIIGSLCFVICYYLLEFLVRKYLVPVYFPENRISHIRSTIQFSIRARFYIYFFAVTVFPLLLVNSIFLARKSLAPLREVVAVISVAVVFLGVFLTFIFSRSYQNPLNMLMQAARRIEKGDYDVEVPVVSNDEVGKLCEGINDMAGGLREKEFIKDTFGKVVDPRVRDHLLEGNVDLGGEMKEATVLFSDIRSFTAISEKMEPGEVVTWLNRYFERMSRCVSAEKGLVNKYIGDAIMAIFGVPLELHDHADAAMRAAYCMLHELDELNRELEVEGLPPMRIGIGLHTGRVLAGNIGSSDRMEYTVIGNTVNVASRLEALTKEYDRSLLISESTSGALSGTYGTVCMNEVRIRGKEEPMNVYYCVTD